MPPHSRRRLQRTLHAVRPGMDFSAGDLPHDRKRACSLWAAGLQAPARGSGHVIWLKGNSMQAGNGRSLWGTRNRPSLLRNFNPSLHSRKTGIRDPYTTEFCYAAIRTAQAFGYVINLHTNYGEKKASLTVFHLKRENWNGFSVLAPKQISPAGWGREITSGRIRLIRN